MNKSLSIGIVVDQLLAGGVQLAAIEQVKELRKLGHNARLLILMRKKYSTDFSYLVRKIPHQYLSDSYPLLFRKTIKLPIFSFLSTLHLISPILAPKVIKKGEYDILISLGTTTCLTTQAIYKISKIPYIAVIHDPIVYILEKAYKKTFLRFFFPLLFPIARFFEKSFVKDAKKTIIISKVHYNYLKSNYGITPVIHTFGAKTLETLPRARGDLLISFGRWQKEKNPFFLLTLIKKLPHTKLSIAGSWTDEREFEEFKEKIKEEKLQNRISLIPYYDEDKLRALCKSARLFIHPHFEAFGLAALEAAGHGLPIIVPQKSGVTENFQHGIHGYFPSNISVSEYTFYVKKLLSDKKKAYILGKNAWKVVKKKLSWKANTLELLKLVEEVMPVKPTIFVLEIGHALGTQLAGGDKLMEPMAVRLQNQYSFSIIVSSIGATHWRQAPLNKKLTILKRNRFDEGSNPVQIFLAYCTRMLQTYRLLKEKIGQGNLSKTHTNQTILYSSTNILPDVLPAFFIKKRFSDIRWLGRIHHLIPQPHKREGNFLVNLVSYIMQYVSLSMMKSSADLTIALNFKLKTDLQKRGFKKEKVKVLGGGIEFQKINSNTVEKENKRKQKKITFSKTKFNAVFLGRLHITKGVFDTIPIWEHVVKKIPEARLAIIGDGPYDLKSTLHNKIKNARLRNNIYLLGFLQYEKVYDIMKNADLFLFLDHEAGWGLAVAEAMACGLPVVGYNNGILGSVYKNGYVATSLGDHKKTADHIVKLVNNNPLRRKLAQKAYLEAAKHDWKITSKKFSDLLENDVLNYN